MITMVSIILVLVIKYLVHLTKNNKIQSKYQPLFLFRLRNGNKSFFSSLIDSPSVQNKILFTFLVD
jgi:hypothetical protein